MLHPVNPERTSTCRVNSACRRLPRSLLLRSRLLSWPGPGGIQTRRCRLVMFPLARRTSVRTGTDPFLTRRRASAHPERPLNLRTLAFLTAYTCNSRNAATQADPPKQRSAPIDRFHVHHGRARPGHGERYPPIHLTIARGVRRPARRPVPRRRKAKREWRRQARQKRRQENRTRQGRTRQGRTGRSKARTKQSPDAAHLGK
jgi:hypothetical protein